MRVENQTKTRVWEESSLCPETSTKSAVQEFHLRTPAEHGLTVMSFPNNLAGKQEGDYFLMRRRLDQFSYFPSLSIFLLFCCCKQPRVYIYSLPWQVGILHNVLFTLSNRKKTSACAFYQRRNSFSFSFFSEHEEKNLSSAMSWWLKGISMSLLPEIKWNRKNLLNKI
jgi:hypothetical protein